MSEKEKFMLPINILRILSEYGGKMKVDAIAKKLQCDDEYLNKVINDLVNEGYVLKTKDMVEISVNRVIARW